MAEHFPNLRKETNIQIQESQRVTNKRNPKRLMPRHIILKMSKVKENKNIKRSKRKNKNLLHVRETPKDYK